MRKENTHVSRPDLEERFPELFAPRQWKEMIQIRCFTLASDLPSKERVSSVNVIPFIGDVSVVISAVGLGPMVPGGTREPDEELPVTASRELMEEAGTCLLAWSPLGWWSLHSDRPEPYRPWLPHPDFLRVILIGEVEIVGAPTQPDGGEVIECVEVLPVPDIVARFERVGRPELADLYRLAAHVRAERTDRQRS